MKEAIRTPRKKPKRLSKADKDNLVWDFLCGCTRKDLAADYGVSLSTVDRLTRGPRGKNFK